MVGDHMGIQGVVVFVLFLLFDPLFGDVFKLLAVWSIIYFIFDMLIYVFY